MPTGSVTDLVVTLGREVTRDEINEAYHGGCGRPARRASCSVLEDPLVSTDIVGNPHSCIFDSC